MKDDGQARPRAGYTSDSGERHSSGRKEEGGYADDGQHRAQPGPTHDNGQRKVGGEGRIGEAYGAERNMKVPKPPRGSDQHS